jgi:hypothetical protein
MNKKGFAIIEIGSNNTKTHIYEDGKLIYENNTTIEFKKNYQIESKINESDWNKLIIIIQKTLEYTKNVHIYGCSIFRNIKENELDDINSKLKCMFNVQIEVVSQDDEAYYTVLGCYEDIDYHGNICVFIGGGGSIELLFINNKKIIDKKYYNFGVVDITKKFGSLKEDVPTCTFDEVYYYVNELMGNIDVKAEILILAGGDHLYWYHNAGYQMLENTLYYCEKQKYMITREMSDNYDHNAFITSLNRIRENSDNPLWFDGSRAMKVITNLVSHKIDSKYIIPTKINMEDGLKVTI